MMMMMMMMTMLIIIRILMMMNHLKCGRAICYHLHHDYFVPFFNSLEVI